MKWVKSTRSYFDDIYDDDNYPNGDDDYNYSESDDDDNSLHRRFPRMGLTENGSATFNSSGNPCLDFFFNVVPDTPSSTVIERLNLAYKHNSLTTLKLIANLRGVRGTGKTDRENFFTSALWLHENHPKTLACNLETFVQFGCFKDLPEILYRLLEGPQIRKEKKEAWSRTKQSKKAWRRSLKVRYKSRKRRDFYSSKNREKNVDWMVEHLDLDREEAEMKVLDKERNEAEEEEDKRKEIVRKRLLRAKVCRQERVEANMIKVKNDMEEARNLRKLKVINMLKRAEERYEKDESYRFLHDRISSVFAECLYSDILSLNSNELKRISLAAKWCPSVDSSYDKATLLCKSIGKLIFPRESSTEYAALSEEQYVYMVRYKLRKEVLVPLHEALKLPEVYMSAKEWTSIHYERVASVAMKNYTDIFLHRDNTRFREYLEKVEAGNSKIAAGALLPHEIIEKNSKGSTGERMVSEFQWKRLVDDLLSQGKLTNSLAVCDVSGSMKGTPMEVCVALGLLVSEISEEPWKGHVITFSSNPQLHLIKPGDLKSKTKFIRKMDWGMNTDFQKVFQRILNVAVDAKLPEDQMIKRLFVFSDMEFDQASSRPWETDYMVIEREYKTKGYQVPEIVFWNLRESSSTPVTAKQNGVALISGFSKNLLALFLEEGGARMEDVKDQKSDRNPDARMEASISGKMYQNLVVYD